MLTLRSLFFLGQCCLASALLSTTGLAAIQTYPRPSSAVEGSPLYAVTVSQGAQREEAFVHLSRARPDGPGSQYVQGRTLSYAGFALSGTATVEVQLRENPLVAPGTVVVRPLRFGIRPELVNERTVRFTIPRAGQYVVEFGAQGYRHGLVIAADPWAEGGAPASDAPTVYWHPEKQRGIAAEALGDRPVIAFARGVHDLGGNYRVPAQVREIYLAPGALVYGAFYIGHSDVRVHGRGVLSGARLQHREAHLIETPPPARRVVIDGLFCADFPYYAIRTLGREARVQWVKCVGAWVYNADGLVAWDGTTLAHNFVQADDDAIKLYGSDILVHDCVIWQVTNGAPFQLGWESLEGHRVRVRDIDVVRTEWRQAAGANNSVVNLRLPKGSGRTQSDFLFERIRVETPVWRFVDLRFLNKRQPPEGKPDGGPHHLRDFVFRDCDVTMPEPRAGAAGNHFRSFDREHGYENIRFENLRINGRTITEANYATAGQFVIPPEDKAQVRFGSPTKN